MKVNKMCHTWELSTNSAKESDRNNSLIKIMQKRRGTLIQLQQGLFKIII